MMVIDALFLHLGLLVALIVAGITDVRHGRIPNWLTFSLAGFGIGMQSWGDGWSGLLFSLEGLVVGLACLLFFYVMGGMGAGDVKLLGAIGAVLGPGQVLYVFACAAILGGMYSFGILMAQLGWKSAIERVQYFLLTLRFTRTVSEVSDQRVPVGPKLRYALVLGLGTVMTQMFEIFEWF